MSPEIYVSIKEGGTSNSLLAPSLSAGLSLRWSLSLSSKTHIYWNVVVFAFQMQELCTDTYMLLSVLKPVDSLLEVFFETYFVY